MYLSLTNKRVKLPRDGFSAAADVETAADLNALSTVRYTRQPELKEVYLAHWFICRHVCKLT
jgi:hypothetical protein